MSNDQMVFVTKNESTFQFPTHSTYNNNIPHRIVKKISQCYFWGHYSKLKRDTNVTTHYKRCAKKDDDHDGASTFSLANAKCYQELRERERETARKRNEIMEDNSPIILITHTHTSIRTQMCTCAHRYIWSVKMSVCSVRTTHILLYILHVRTTYV